MKCKLATIFSVLVLAWLIEDAASEPRLRIGWARRRRRRRHCNKVDCALGSWSSWSSCSHTCGPKGLQHRTRSVVRPASCGGAPCHGPLQESRSCNRVCLNSGVLKYGSRCYCKYGYGGECCQIVSGGWTSWGPWCKCSRTCGKGTQYRKRSCTKPDGSCPGNSREYKSCTLRECKAPDGGWSFWSSWGQCTGSCGTGLQTRKRSCTNPPPGDGGKKCMGATEQHKNCFLQSCPVNGAWSSWAKWSTCSKTCGNGLQISRRSCNNPPPKYGGKTCYGSGTKSRSCHVKSCAVNGGWSFWSKWSSCSKTCGSGSRSRQRSCTKPRPGYGGKPCYGPPQQTQSCNTKKCPVNGGWSKWGPWGACSKTCGDGKQYSRRTCNNPAPKYGGKKCFGASVKPQTCNVKPCPVNGRWGSWSKWCACSKTCGTGTQYRKRYCTNPRPTSGGKQCKGLNKQNKKCNTKACPVNGGWSLWGKWCACSKTCGTGTQNRARSCTKPRPAYGGKYCSGLSREYLKCNKQACPVNGRWTLWGAWSKCTKTCGTGSQTRRRSCSNPPPQQGGKTCKGPSEQNKSCLLKKCPVYGGWSSWAKWSVCSKSCGTGTQHRSRTCSGYRAGYGGCPGSDKENRKCNSQSCPVINGGWGDWSHWSPCSATCGPGTSFRTRPCDNPAPGPGGSPCPGVAISSKDCNLKACAGSEDCWDDWSDWSKCTKGCGCGRRFRVRYCQCAHGQQHDKCQGLGEESESCQCNPCPNGPPNDVIEG